MGAERSLTKATSLAATFISLKLATGRIGHALIAGVAGHGEKVAKGGFQLARRAALRLTSEFFVALAGKLRGRQSTFAMPELRKDNFLGVFFDRFNRRQR